VKNSKESSVNDPPEELQPFVTLRDHVRPAMPTDESVRLFSGQVWRFFRKAQKDPFIHADRLRRASRRRLNDLLELPDYGILVREMQSTFENWVADAEPANWLQLVVLPPCDRKSLVREWAVEHNHTLLTAPEPDEILDPKFEPLLPEVAGDGVVVVPQLERWFLRHERGLRVVRILLKRLATLQRHCVVGCNSWAWEFLSTLVGADMVFPAAVTFQSFHARRLRQLFVDLSASHEAKKCFRLSSNGQDIFETKEDQSPVSDYFARLAARSYGIPWVAWHMWRREIRLKPDDSDKTDQKFPDEETIWITEADEFELPTGLKDSVLLVLHALLIHDGLSEKQLSSVLPGIDPMQILAALLSAEFIDREDTMFRCTPAAYPTARKHLINAGFPGDKL